MDLMDKVRQVGENYELNKYKALNKTVELDARLANDRLLATKLRLSQVSSLNDKLGKQLRSVQQQYRVQEKKLLLTETMLRQLVDSRAERSHHHHHSHKVAAPAAPTTSRLARFRGRKAASQQQREQEQQVASSNEKNATLQNAPTEQVNIVKGQLTEANSNLSSGNRTAVDLAELATAQSNSATVTNSSGDAATGQVVAIRKVSNSATQTQMSRTKTIISDLRQRLNLVGSKAKGLRDNNNEPVITIQVPQLVTDKVSEIKTGNLLDRAVQTSPAGMEDVGIDVEFDELVADDDTFQNDDDDDDAESGDEDIDFDADEYDAYLFDEHFDNSDRNNLRKASLDIHHRATGRRRSVSLNDILGSSYIHEAPSGERIIISRGWPSTVRTTKNTSSRLAKKPAGRKSSTSSKHLPLSLPISAAAASSFINTTHHGRRASIVTTTSTSGRRQSFSSQYRQHNPPLGGLIALVTSDAISPPDSSSAVLRRRSISEFNIKQVRERSERRHRMLNEEQKRRLLVEFLKTQAANEGAKLLAQQRVLPPPPPPPTSLVKSGVAKQSKPSITNQGGRILVNKSSNDVIDENTELEGEEFRRETKRATMTGNKEQQIIAMPMVKVKNARQSSSVQNITANLETTSNINNKKLPSSNNKVSAMDSAKQISGETNSNSEQERLVERAIDTTTRTRSPLLLSAQTQANANVEEKKDNKVLKKPLVVQYDLPVHSGKPIALGGGVDF